MGPEEQYAFYNESTDFQAKDPNKTRRMIIGGAGLLMFLMIVGIVLTLLLSSPSVRPNLAKIASLQSETIRISDIALDSNRLDRQTASIATNFKIIATDSIAKINFWVDNNLDTSLTETELFSETNEQYDTALAQAEELNTYDQTFKQIIEELTNQTYNEINGSSDLIKSDPKLLEISQYITDNITTIYKSLEIE